MCITKDCPKPTTEGVWWRDDARWVLYNESNANSIRENLASGVQTVDLGIIPSAVHPNGDPYKADLFAMQQYNVRSGYRREILVIEPDDKSSSEELSATACESSEEEEASEVEPKVHYRDKQGNLQQYPSRMARQIIGAFSQMKGKLVVDIDSHCSVNLAKMEHVDKHSGECMNIIVEVPMPWLHFLPNSIHRKQFLSAVLEELSLLDCCSSILEKRSSPHQIVSKKVNPKAKAGTKLFDTFADTLLEMEQVIFEDIMKQMWKIVSTKQNDESDYLQYVFQKEANKRKRKRVGNTDDVKENGNGGYARVPMPLDQACNLKKFKFVVSMVVLVYDDHQLKKGMEGYIPTEEIKCAIPILTVEISYNMAL